MNGENGLHFSLLRSVQQGCPLSPYIFILIIDVLGYVLSNPCYGVWGLKLSNGGILRDQSFANNVTLYLECLAKNLEKACGVFFLFCIGAGEKINWHKSSTIWAFNNQRDFDWGKKKGYVGFFRDKE
jgi:hypothetical protein